MDINFSISLKLDKVSLKNLKEDITIENIKLQLSKVWKSEINDFNFYYKGQILKENMTLKDAGLLSGAMVHCLPNNDVDPPAAAPLSLIEVQQLLVSIRAAVAKSNFRTFIQKLRKPEQVARLVSECPALRRDPAALAFIQDDYLVESLQQADHLTKLIEMRPVLGHVLQIVCNLITSEVASPNRSRRETYSLDALSDEEMDFDNDARHSRGQGESSSQFITPAQLAAALANASGSGGGSAWGGARGTSRSETATPSSTPLNTPALTSASGGSGAAGSASPGASMITSEMFSQALQNAISLSSRPMGSSASGPSSATSQPLENVEESLQLMTEMGIPDRELSLQALQASNGDVQAAVNLIFSQWMADD